MMSYESEKVNKLNFVETEFFFWYFCFYSDSSLQNINAFSCQFISHTHSFSPPFNTLSK